LVGLGLYPGERAEVIGLYGARGRKVLISPIGTSRSRAITALTIGPPPPPNRRG
jgi:hypothetical protein